MPRDAATTRDALIRAGRELMARPGGLSTPVKDIVLAAGQRNVSALHYHFGGRRGLIDTIIDLDGAQIEAARAVMLEPYGPNCESATLADLVDALIAPQAVLLNDPAGRQFLSIVSQLDDLFDQWDDESGATPPQALRTLRAIEARLPERLASLVRRERVTRLLELVAGALGSRARQIDSGRVPALATDEFVTDLDAMSIGALSAPPRIEEGADSF